MEHEDLEGIMFGNEKYVTSKHIQKLMINRRNCKHAVLGVQARQMAFGYHDPQELARASRYFSKSDSQRAQKIGLFQSCGQEKKTKEMPTLR